MRQVQPRFQGLSSGRGRDPGTEVARQVKINERVLKQIVQQKGRRMMFGFSPVWRPFLQP